MTYRIVVEGEDESLKNLEKWLDYFRDEDRIVDDVARSLFGAVVRLLLVTNKIRFVGMEDS